MRWWCWWWWWWWWWLWLKTHQHWPELPRWGWAGSLYKPTRTSVFQTRPTGPADLCDPFLFFPHLLSFLWSAFPPPNITFSHSLRRSVSTVPVQLLMNTIVLFLSSNCHGSISWNKIELILGTNYKIHWNHGLQDFNIWYQIGTPCSFSWQSLHNEIWNLINTQTRCLQAHRWGGCLMFVQSLAVIRQQKVIESGIKLPLCHLSPLLCQYNIFYSLSQV